MQGKGHFLAFILLIVSFHCSTVLTQNTGTASNSAETKDGTLRIFSTPKMPASQSSSSSSETDHFSAPVKTAVESPKQTVVAQSLAMPASISTVNPPAFAQQRLSAPVMFPRPPNHPVRPLLRPDLSYSLFDYTKYDSEDSAGGANADNDEGHCDCNGDRRRHGGRFKRSRYAAPYFVGKRPLGERSELELFSTQYLQQQKQPLILESRSGSPPRLARRFIGRRHVPLFVGKRWRQSSLGHDGAGALMLAGRYQDGGDPYSVGQRQVFLLTNSGSNPHLPYLRQRRGLPQRMYAPLFVGRRSSDDSFSDKRAAPLFVGRRDKNDETMFDKRAAPLFIGRRDDDETLPDKKAAPLFVGRRESDDMASDKRAAPLFVGRREELTASMAGKRSAPLFIGKREDESLSELLAALHALRAAHQYRRMIQTDKRHNTPFFVGKKSSPVEEVEDNSGDKRLEEKDYVR